jgi:hypothetical protein
MKLIMMICKEKKGSVSIVLQMYVRKGIEACKRLSRMKYSEILRME